MIVGNYHLSVVHAGFIGLDGGAMFGIIPKTLWQKTNPADEFNRITLAMRLLLIEDESRKILIDSGAGMKMSPKEQQIYRLDYTKNLLLTELTKQNISPDEITDVILTHLHFDHSGGTTNIDNDGQLMLTFPNATHYVQKEQYKWALNPEARDGASFIKENFVPIKDAGKLELTEGEIELFPGITVLPIYGHTKAQQLVKITDSKTTILFVADLCPTKSHIRIPYEMGYDLEPLKTIEEKKRILPQAFKNDWILFFEHDPETTAGKLIEAKHGGFVFGEEISFNNKN